MKGELDKIKKEVNLIVRALDGYLTGVCVVGNDEKIEYINQKGLDIIKCKDFDECAGKDFRDIFSINESSKKMLLEMYKKKNSSTHNIDIKLCDGTSAKIQVNVTFASGDSGFKVSGIFFSKS